MDNYGGLWIDSTVYCSSKLSDKYFKHIYTSGGYSYNQCLKFYFFKWTEFLIGGDSHSTIFRFMNEFLKLYWKKNDTLIDYFLVDYGLMYVYQHNLSNFKVYVDNVACNNNPCLYKLVNNMNKPYNYTKYKKIRIYLN